MTVSLCVLYIKYLLLVKLTENLYIVTCHVVPNFSESNFALVFSHLSRHTMENTVTITIVKSLFYFCDFR